MENNSILKIALVGCGAVADDHIKAWRKVLFGKVTAVCDIHRRVAMDFAKRWKIPRVYYDIEDLLMNENVSVVDVCTPPMTHKDLGIKIMRYKRNVLFEKPLTLSTEDARLLVEEEKINNVHASVVHNILFEPSILKLRSLIKSGLAGKVMHVNIEWLQTGKDPMTLNKNHWCHSIPGGRIGEMLPHPIYLLQEFLGHDLIVERVLACKKGKSILKYDEVQLLLRNDNGFGTIYISFNSPRDSIYLTVHGSKLVLKAEVITQTLLTEKQLDFHSRLIKGKDVILQSFQMLRSLVNYIPRVILGKWMSGHDTFIYEYAKSVIERKPPPVRLEDAFKTVEICEKIITFLN